MPTTSHSAGISRQTRPRPSLESSAVFIAIS
jgi:hypothetical protein